MPDLELGTRVRYSRVLRRDATLRTDGRGENKFWGQTPVDGEWGDPSKVRVGIVYGLRTYSNGLTTWGWGGEDSEPTTYSRRASLAVALVSWDARRKPDAVRVEDLTIIEGEE